MEVASRDVFMYAKMIFPQYKVKMSHILQNMYMFCRFDEVFGH